MVSSTFIIPEILPGRLILIHRFHFHAEIIEMLSSVDMLDVVKRRYQYRHEPLILCRLEVTAPAKQVLLFQVAVLSKNNDEGKNNL